MRAPKIRPAAAWLPDVIGGVQGRPARAASFSDTRRHIVVVLQEDVEEPGIEQDREAHWGCLLRVVAKETTLSGGFLSSSPRGTYSFPS